MSVMLPSLKLIKQMRVKLGITQKALSDMVGISKSMMNQIETGRSSTSYDTAKRIFDCLATMESRTSQRTVYELCSKKIVSIKPTDTINHAIKIMQKSSISQIPVFDKFVVVGLISEDQIMLHLSEGKKIKNIKVVEIMIEPPPVVRPFNTSSGTSAINEIFKMSLNIKEWCYIRNYNSVRHSKTIRVSTIRQARRQGIWDE